MPSAATVSTSVTFVPVLDRFRHEDTGDALDEGLCDSFRRLAQDFFGETDDTRDAMVAQLKDALRHRGFVVPDKRAFYLKILRAGGFTIDGAVSVLTNYIRHLIEYPRYMNRAKASQAALLCSMNMHTVLPHRDRHGRRVYIMRPGVWDPDKFTFSDCYAIGYMMSELIALEPKTQVAGVTVISDANNFGFKQFKSFTIEDARKSAGFIQDSFPLWFRTIHMVNAHRFFHLAFALVRPMLTEAVRKSIVFHPTLQSLHDEVDKSILPAELGGDAGPFDNSTICSELEQMGPVLDECKAYRIRDDSK